MKKRNQNKRIRKKNNSEMMQKADLFFHFEIINNLRIKKNTATFETKTRML